jgi:hypothetical protein
MVSLVAVMQNGATVETATIGRAGVIGASAGLGARSTMARAIVQLPGTAAWLSATQFHAAAAQRQTIRDSSCATTTYCLRKSSNRSRAMRWIALRPGFAGG